jgi:sialate O-acetylesterase
VEKPVTLTDVLVGEVWLGAGQSNMQIGDDKNPDETIAAVTRIRNGSKERSAVGYMQLDGLGALKEARNKVLGTDWPLVRWFNGRAPTSKWAPWVGKDRYTGLLMYFGQRLHLELGVPVGLLHAAQGGTATALWLTPEMLENCPLYQTHLQRLETAGLTEEYTKEFPREKLGEHYRRQIAAKMIPFAIRGVYWDQGESGTGLPSAYYPPVLTALITGWRKAWGQEFVFLYTGKNGLGDGSCTWDLTNPVTAGGLLLAPLPNAPAQLNVSHEESKNAYWQYLDLRGTLPGIEMIITSDLGGGLHPYNKYGYGNRTASLALGKVYGKAGEYYGPVYKSHRIEGKSVRITFDHVGSGLAVKTNDAIRELQGFAVAGKDKVFHWAKARIDGNEVVLTCDAVTEPVAIRYAWDHRGARWANLFNKEGYPALPFRTDD